MHLKADNVCVTLVYFCLVVLLCVCMATFYLVSQQGFFPSSFPNKHCFLPVLLLVPAGNPLDDCLTKSLNTLLYKQLVIIIIDAINKLAFDLENLF